MAYWSTGLLKHVLVILHICIFVLLVHTSLISLSGFYLSRLGSFEIWFDARSSISYGYTTGLLLIVSEGQEERSAASWPYFTVFGIKIWRPLASEGKYLCIYFFLGFIFRYIKELILINMWLNCFIWITHLVGNVLIEICNCSFTSKFQMLQIIDLLSISGESYTRDQMLDMVSMHLL